ncbi:hypothetical protein Tco_1405729 [Tanacetum coccineum]
MLFPRDHGTSDIPTVIPSTSVVALETSTIAPVISSAASMVETTLVASPTGLCGLVPYSGSDSDSPDEMSSLEHISPLPAISPFLCIDSSEAPDSSDGQPSQDPYVATVACWRSRVTACPSSSSEFTIALVTTPPRFVDVAILISDPGRLFLLVDLTTLILTGRVWMHQIRLILDLRLEMYHPIEFTLRRSTNDAVRHFHRCGCSTIYLYPPTQQSHPSGDYSSEGPCDSSSHAAGPSRKRCRSPVDSVPLSTPVMGSLAPTRADLLPPRKRFRDSYSSEASIEEDAEVGHIETGVDMELEDVWRLTPMLEHNLISIDPMSAPIVEEEIVEPAREDSSDSSGTRDGIVRSVEDMPVDLDDVVRDFYHHMYEVRVDRIVEIESAQRRLEADQLIASGDRARMAEMIYSLRLENLKVRAMLDIERDRVNSLRLHMSLSYEEFVRFVGSRDELEGD